MSDVIHRYWEGSPSPDDNLASIREHHPDVEVITWTPETLPPWVTRIIDSTREYIFPAARSRHAANVVRYAMLWRHGGTWMDHDLMLEGPAPDVEMAVGSHGGRSTCTCWMAFPRRSPYMRAALEAIQDPSRHHLQLSTSLSGEVMLDALLPPEVPRMDQAAWATHIGRRGGARQIVDVSWVEGWVEYAPNSEQDLRVLALIDGGREVVRIVYRALSGQRCHIDSVLVVPTRRREGLATMGIELLTLKYRYFSSTPRNDNITALFAKFHGRDDITAWPRQAFYLHGRLHYIPDAHDASTGLLPLSR